MIPLRQAWTEQPQEAIEVSPDGFLRSPRFLVLGSTPEIDLATRSLTTVSGYQRVLNIGGVTASSSATANNTDRILGNTSGDLSGPLTLFWVGRLRQTSSNQYDSLIGNGTVSAANGINIGIWGATGADKDKPFFETFSTVSTQKFTPISSQVAVSQTDIQVLVGTTDKTTLSLYQNGRLVSSVATAGALPGTSTSPWRVGARGSFTAGAAQEVILAGALSGNRSAAEVAEFTRNIWEGFTPRTIYIPISITAGAITRPNSDVTVTGWTGDPDNVNLYANIDETSPSDTDFIISPDLGGSPGPAIFGLTQSLATGTYDIRFRASRTGTSGQIRALLQDSGGSTVGTSAWQTLTASAAQYTLNVTTSGSASRVRLEVQA